MAKHRRIARTSRIAKRPENRNSLDRDKCGSQSGLVGACLMFSIAACLQAGFAEASEPSKTWPISCFIYADIDRSGTYTLADRPYAGLLVEVERPDGSVVRNRSNIAGFANFKLGFADYENSDFYDIGTYKANSVVPLDWIAIEPKPLEQQIIAERDANVGGGMVLTKPCDHIGVAPELIVRGRIETPPESQIENIRIEAIGPDGKETSVEMNEAGFYRFQASRGDWQLKVSDQETGNVFTRAIPVGNYNVLVSDTSISEQPMESIPGRVRNVSFDNVTSSDTLYELPSGYEGLNWQYWVATHQKFYGGYGYVNATVSGEYMAYTSSGLPATFWSEKPFDFIGTHVGAAWPRGEEEYVTVKAWRGNKLAYEDQFLITISGPEYFAADYRQVDRVEFSHGNYERIVIDDLSFRN